MYADETKTEVTQATQAEKAKKFAQVLAGRGHTGQGHSSDYDKCIGQSPYRPPTLREEAEKQIGYHREQADKADRAVAFLRENPAFDEFVRLVRAGVIQF